MNVADLMTRGAGPKDLTEDSEWQKGPGFLYLTESEWPKRFARDVAAAARGNLERIQKKSFVAALNRTYLKEEEFAAKHRTEWTWKINPADSLHRNGAAEAAVRVTKKALQSLGKGTNLSFSEFLKVLQLAANLGNERPIDARAQSLEDRLEYVTPNSLLLGRASQSGDIKSFNFDTYPYKRLREIQAQVNHFWKSWSQLAGPNLFVREKWHTTERNVAIGDIVWLCDQNALRGQFTLHHCES